MKILEEACKNIYSKKVLEKKYTFYEMIEFATWFGNCVYYSGGDNGNAYFAYKKYIDGFNPESYMYNEVIK